MQSLTSQIDELGGEFFKRFGAPRAEHIAYAPGRVNLIGEHIDYNGLPVLPMAIDRGVLMLLRPRQDNVVRVENADGRFYRAEFHVKTDIPTSPTGDWVNYLKAPVQALARTQGASMGFDALVGTSLPVAAGLSSSSSLVVATALAVNHVNGIDLDPMALAGLLAAAERYVGTQGGGMDQAICLGAQPGTASRVTFEPLGMTRLRIPSKWHFVVAHSLTDAEKSGGARDVYNRRTEECTAALAIVAATLGQSVRSYSELLTGYPATAVRGAADTGLEGPLAARFRHVTSEARRVFEAERALRTENLRAFGKILIASHMSLRDEYEVSTPELDTLTEIAMDAGAAGARLTGAGLGGCILAVCHADETESLLSELADRYYGPRGRMAELDQWVFKVTPSGGAFARAR